MDYEAVKQRLLADPATRAAYEHPPLPIAIARAVVTRRRALGMSQQDLADRLGTSQTQVWRIESGQANLTLETLGKLAEVLQFALEVRLPEAAPSATAGRRAG